jgi:hypothetical protein
MPSSYTTNGGIEKIATGEQSGTWGSTTNTNFDIIDRLTTGVGTIDLSSSGAAHTLTTTDGTLSDGMYRVLVLSGATQACTITVAPNDAQKIYFVNNSTSYTCTFTQGSGSNVAVAASEKAILYCDGNGATAAVVNALTPTDLTGYLQASNNLSDVSSAVTALTNLGLTATAAEVNLNDGASAGTIVNSKTVVYGSSGEVNATTLQVGGTAITSTPAELNLLDGASAGSINNSKAAIYGSSGELNTAILQLNSIAVTASSAELNILDGVTATTSELNILDGVTATTAELNYNDITTLGTSEASKTVTADANGDVTLSEELKAKSYNETYATVSSSSGTLTIDCEAGNVFQTTLSENVTTLTVSNAPSSGTAYGFILRIVQDTTARTVTWPASFKFSGGIEPTVSTASGAIDVYGFFTTDGGTNWYAFTAGQDMS